MVSNVANKNLEKAYPRKYFLFSKMSWRRLQSNNFSSFKTSSRRVCKTFFKDVFKTSSRCICKTSSSRRLQDVFKTFSRRRLERQKSVTLKTSSRRLQYVFIKTNVCWDMMIFVKSWSSIRIKLGDILWDKFLRKILDKKITYSWKFL